MRSCRSTDALPSDTLSHPFTEQPQLFMLAFKERLRAFMARQQPSLPGHSGAPAYQGLGCQPSEHRLDSLAGHPCVQRLLISAVRTAGRLLQMSSSISVSAAICFQQCLQGQNPLRLGMSITLREPGLSGA